MASRSGRRGVWLAVVLAAPLLAGLCLAHPGGLPRTTSPVSPDTSARVIRSMEHRLPRVMKTHHLPSVAVALIDGQETVWAKAFGLANIETNIPATVNTVYRQWSLAKVLTAIETLRLVEEGRVRLDAPVTAYLPDFSIESRFADSGPITIRSLLAHRSGLPRNGGLPDLPDYVIGPGILRDKMLSLANARVAFPVGARFKYSNAGYDLLGLLIERVRGEAFPFYMRDHLLAPIGMRRAAFLSAGLPAEATIATGYEFLEGTHHPILRGECTSLPSGNLYASLTDMTELVTFIFRGGESGGAQIVKRATLAAMVANQYASPGDPQTNGLGWFTNETRFGEKLIWHHGGDSGTNVLIALLPGRQLGVVLFANESSFSAAYGLPLAADALELMLDARRGAAAAPRPESPAIAVDTATLEKYAGKYVVFGEVMDVFLSGRQLKGRVQGMGVNLVPIARNRFRMSHWLMTIGLARLLPVDLRQFEVEFLTGALGEATGMVIHGARVHAELCPRLPAKADETGLARKLRGRYEIVYRFPSGDQPEKRLGETEITMEGPLLRSRMGVLHPIDATHLIVVGGPYDAETVAYDPDTGCLRHQGLVYKPRPREL